MAINAYPSSVFEGMWVDLCILVLVMAFFPFIFIIANMQKHEESNKLGFYLLQGCRMICSKYMGFRATTTHNIVSF